MRIRPTWLRHSALRKRRRLEAGPTASVPANRGELYALKDILGHKSISMTQRYAHLSPAYRRSMVDRMELIWARPTIPPIEPIAVKRQHARRRGRITEPAVAMSAQRYTYKCVCLIPVSLGRRGHPDPRKAIIGQKPQQQVRISPIGLLFPFAIGADLRRIPDHTSRLNSANIRSNHCDCPLASIPTRTDPSSPA